MTTMAFGLGKPSTVQKLVLREGVNIYVYSYISSATSKYSFIGFMYLAVSRSDSNNAALHKFMAIADCKSVNAFTPKGPR